MTTTENGQRDELAQLIAYEADRRCGFTASYPPPAQQDRELADAIIAAGYTKPRIIETVEELGALPVGSVVLTHWPDSSYPNYQMTRCREGAASSGGGIGLAGGPQWLEMVNWGATLTVLWEPDAEVGA